VTISTGPRGVMLATLLGVLSCALLPGHRTAEPPPVDLNRGSVRKLEQLPGVTPSMARRIVEGRPYGDPEELVARGILSEHELARLGDRVKVAR